MKEKLIKEDGYNLIEVLIILGIVVMIGMTLVNALTSSDKVFRYSYSQSENAMAAQNVLNTIVSELKFANEIITPAPNGTSDKVEYTTEINNSMIVSCSIRRDSSSDSIIITKGASSKTIAPGLIRGITFKRDSINPGKIVINLSINGKVKDSKIFSVNTTVTLLNLNN